MAVRVGFEPTEPFRAHFFSKEALSTTQPPNRVESISVISGEIRSAESASDGSPSQGGFVQMGRFYGALVEVSLNRTSMAPSDSRTS